MRARAGEWGARKIVTDKVSSAMSELFEIFMINGESDQTLSFDISFDELSIDITAKYKGEPFSLTANNPTQNELLESSQGVIQLSAFLMTRYADKVTTSVANGVVTVNLHFEH